MQAVDEAIYLGRLMSPEEITQATLGRTEIPFEVRNSWCLCGDITDELWDALRENPERYKGFRLSAFTTPNNSVYVTVTVQLRDMQSRFLLSMSNSKVVQFIDDAQKMGVWLSLGRNDGHQAILQRFLVDAEHFRPIAALARRGKTLSPAEAIRELQLAAFVAQEPGTVPSAVPGFDVRQVSLTIIAPD